MEFYGVIQKIIKKDELTGITFFSVSTDDKTIPLDPNYNALLCKGVLPDFDPGMPIYLEGNIEINGQRQFFEAKTCKPLSKNEATTLSFLSSGKFSNIGSATASAIIKISNNDIFSFCKQENAIEILSRIPRMNEAIAKNLVNKINQYSDMQELIDYITAAGGSYLGAKAIYSKYGNRSLSVVKDNPYLLFKAGLTFAQRESLAKKQNIIASSPIRVYALIREVFTLIENRGNTCIPLTELFSMAEYIETETKVGYRTSPLHILAIILNRPEKFKFEIFENRLYIYHRKMYEYEKKIQENVRRLITNRRFVTPKAEIIEKIEKECGIKYDEQQKRAFSLMQREGIAILTGGPGTGKSTVINGLLHYYKRIFPNARIALTAPTGTAAKRIRQVTGEDAKTIHKLLDIRPYGENDVLQYNNEHNQLQYDLIIADEFSMVDSELCSMLLTGIKQGSMLLIVGDENQLGSVGAGNVLHDLMKSQIIPFVRLTNVYRQQEGSAIIENSIRIRQGRCDLLEDDTFRIIRANNQDEMQKITLDLMKNTDASKYNIKLYSPIKKEKFPVSTFNLNNQIHSMLDFRKEESIVYNKTVFSRGDKVIMLSNNYKVGYLNGDEGKIVNIFHFESYLTPVVEIQLYDGTIFQIYGENLEDMALAYAITIHKSQGSECDTSLILLPLKPNGMLERSLVYVGITRAKQKNIIISEKNALEKGILSNKCIMRTTGLAYLLQRE